MCTYSETGNKAPLRFPHSLSSLPHTVCQCHRRRQQSDLWGNGHAKSCQFKSCLEVYQLLHTAPPPDRGVRVVKARASERCDDGMCLRHSITVRGNLHLTCPSREETEEFLKIQEVLNIMTIHYLVLFSHKVK